MKGVFFAGILSSSRREIEAEGCVARIKRKNPGTSGMVSLRDSNSKVK